MHFHCQADVRNACADSSMLLARTHSAESVGSTPPSQRLAKVHPVADRVRRRWPGRTRKTQSKSPEQSPDVARESGSPLVRKRDRIRNMFNVRSKETNLSKEND
jgi:hypothetical protein